MNDTEIFLSAGRFANVAFIGRGATANVYRAEDSVIQSEVALKMIYPQLVTDPVSLERFKREIRIARHLNHPQIAAVYDLLDLSGRLCLVMELIEGEILKTHLQLNHPIPVEAVLSMIRQTASVLSDCHQKNVIHRDLNPRNMFISKDGRIRLLDFGIARMTEMSDLTKTGVTNV